MATFPQVHGTLLSIAAAGAVVFGALILARNPKSTTARLHFVYASIVAWWFVSMAMLATSDTTSDAQFWARLVHLSLGMLPGVIYHLNASLAGLSELYRTRIRAHWALSVALTIFAIGWPGFLGVPRAYSWGFYPRYTGWSLLLVASLVLVMVEVTMAYKLALARNDPRTARHQKARAFLRGNMFTMVAMLDFLPTYGWALYPFGYIVITVIHAITLYGSVRYRLIEITPEFAAEHILKEMPDGLLVVDTQGLIQLVNPAAAEALGCEVADLIRQTLDRPKQTPLVDLLRQQDHLGWVSEARYRDEKGTDRTIRALTSTIADQGGFPVAQMWVLHDITHLRFVEDQNAALEESVRRVQKLESLGVMASGVAHDFNNLLMAILGHAEIAGLRAQDPAAMKEHLAKIEDAAERASELTAQMLTYTGKSPRDPRPISPNRLVTDILDLLRAAISKKADLRLELGTDLPSLSGDMGQLSQVVLNLITNAAEALGGDPGAVTVRTGLLLPDESFLSWREPGFVEPLVEHVFIEVEDTGEGMDVGTMGKIFDPFFTTKFAGRGLGLATVVGIVRSHGGLTRVSSVPGRGTTFTVALPVSAETEELPAVRRLAKDAWRGKGIALLADDEPEVRSIVRSMLSEAGFEVIEVVDGREAVSVFRERSQNIAVVVLDQTMPELGGNEAFVEIRKVSTEVPVVFMSGYADALKAVHGPRTSLLHKPFRATMLVTKLREAMEA